MNVRAIIHQVYERQTKPASVEDFWAKGGCLAWPGQCSKAITGTDPTESFRAQFSTEAGALAFLVDQSLADYVAKVYPEVPVSFARSGDWALVANEDGSEGLGVVMGSQIAVSTPLGIGTVSLLRAASAYRVR